MTSRRLVHTSLVLVFTACLAAGVAPKIASAAEVVVRNDSVNDFQLVGIIGDFVPGEKVAARLTAPCAGSIVAVQIVWLAGSPGAPQTLEEAITINADNGGSPVPGTELLLLEGPFMTPGFVNEFRYVDEANTIPIDVPVSQNQSFYVVFEFGTATDINNGSASVVRDLDGCQAQRNSVYGNIGVGLQWYNFCLFYGGDLAIRAVVDCQEQTGACCDGDANCENDVEEGDCQGAQNTFFAGQTCGQVVCPAPTGACCNGVGGCIDGLEQPFCEGAPINGIYAGNNTTCAQDVCDLGACCLPLGDCEDVVEAACGDLGGIFEGPGTSCMTTSCPQPLGACCLGTTCVPNQTEDNCTSFPGSWVGPFTTCAPLNPCLACTDGDADQDGDLDLADFSILQACFGGPDTGACACLDMNNDAIVNMPDVELFIAALSGP